MEPATEQLVCREGIQLKTSVETRWGTQVHGDVAESTAWLRDAQLRFQDAPVSSENRHYARRSNKQEKA
jgi:hypothetical protein